jgi:hypothetical protein
MRICGSALLWLSLLLAAIASTAAPDVASCRGDWTPRPGDGSRCNIDELSVLLAAHGRETRFSWQTATTRLAMLDTRRPMSCCGKTGDRDRVVLHGRHERRPRRRRGSVSASDAAVADLTIRDVGYHAVQVRGERRALRPAQRQAP